jgi:hypothetical protein
MGARYLGRSGSSLHDSYAAGTTRPGATAQYREYAAECYRLASIAKTDADREILRELARAWTKVAEEAEQTETLS